MSVLRVMDKTEIKIEPHFCSIPVDRSECEEKKYKSCQECPHKDKCDGAWMSKLWQEENAAHGNDSVLGPFMPGNMKTDLRSGNVISITGKYDFMVFNVPKKSKTVTMGELYVDPACRGQAISKQIFQWLMNTYDRDLFLKCVRDSSAESYFKHAANQIDANNGNGLDFYEHREGKRDLGWYILPNNNHTIEPGSVISYEDIQGYDNAEFQQKRNEVAEADTRRKEIEERDARIKAEILAKEKEQAKKALKAKVEELW